MEDYHLVIIGAGIVGLATAMEASQRYPHLKLLVLEKEDRVAAHQSSHNSGVIHSGVYYQPGSAKARTCVTGARAMLEFCRANEIPVQVCGKVIVATDERELAALHELHRRGTLNGVPKLILIGKEQLQEIEPNSKGVAALHVPGTVITDYGAVSNAFKVKAVNAGATLYTSAAVLGFQIDRDVVIQTTRGEFHAKYVINCAGLQSDRLSRLAGAKTGISIVPFRGEYYEILPHRLGLVKGLIYPVPDERFPFLGVHFTKKVGGGVEAGPNAILALKREGYSRWDADLGDIGALLTTPGFWKMTLKYWRTGIGEFYRSLSKPAFTRALQRLVPSLREEDLKHGGTGVRAQALNNSSGKLLDDFEFVHSDRMIHVCNVPSPAATASIPIGQTIMQLAAQTFDLARPRFV